MNQYMVSINGVYTYFKQNLYFKMQVEYLTKS